MNCSLDDKRERRKAYYEAHREFENEQRRIRYAANREAQKAAVALWKANNKDRVAAVKKAWKQANPDKNRSSRKQGYIERKRLVAKQKIAIYFRSEIRGIYERCPPDMEVDHIVPLRGDFVCGLHVPWNLQYLTPTANRQKGKRLIDSAAAG